LEQDARRLGVQLEAPVTCAPRAEHGVLFGRYQIVRTAASTPSARVFEAVDRLSNKRVALKQIMAANLVGAGRDAFDRLVREARILQQLRHPNVAPLVDLVEDAGAIITQWMPGGSLADRLANEPVAPARAVEIACAVLGALAEAHRLGILHRDIKPSNILFDEAGAAMLSDFGAAHVSDSSATATAGVIGTLAYMSPEQRAGKPATPASDVFGVGATLLEMLTGGPPALEGRATEPSHANPDLGPQHDAVVLEMLHEDPLRRPASALSARQALLAVAWPAQVPRQAPRAAPQQPSSTAPNARLRAVAGGVFEDTLLGRRVMLMEGSEEALRAARAYAAAACDELPSVVRITPDRAWIWFEHPDGVRLAEHQGAAPDWSALQHALQRLHEHGAAHGAIDREHLFVDRSGALRLAIEPRTLARASPQADDEALANLAGSRDF